MEPWRFSGSRNPRNDAVPHGSGTHREGEGRNDQVRRSRPWYNSIPEYPTRFVSLTLCGQLTNSNVDEGYTPLGKGGQGGIPRKKTVAQQTLRLTMPP